LRDELNNQSALPQGRPPGRLFAFGVPPLAQHVALTPVSNREDWDDTFELFDVDTDTALDLSAVTEMTLTVWDPECPGTAKLTAELDDGITIDDVTGGTVSIHLDSDDMTALCAKSYAFRLAMLNGGAQKDLIIGMLPIEDGGPK
jgi:hypothetical protein